VVDQSHFGVRLCRWLLSGPFARHAEFAWQDKYGSAPVRLQDVVLHVNEKTWQPLGEKYFGLIVRARFATTHRVYHDLLRADGVPARRLKPFAITHCVQGLAAEPDHQDAIERYALLCDFVHHNLASSTTANSGSGVINIALSAHGGGMTSRGSNDCHAVRVPEASRQPLHGDTSGRSTLRRSGSVWARQYGEHTLDVVAEFLHVVA